MSKPDYLRSDLSAIRMLRSAGVGILLLVSMIVLLSSSAMALPRASGSKCNSNWVNNEGALDCFIQGEDETNNGVSNPHYVACTNDGDVMCCQDDPKAGQTCHLAAAIVKSGPSLQVRQIAAILSAQQTTLIMMNKMSSKVETLNAKVDQMNGKVAPARIQPAQ